MVTVSMSTLVEPPHAIPDPMECVFELRFLLPQSFARLGERSLEGLGDLRRERRREAPLKEASDDVRERNRGKNRDHEKRHDQAAFD